MAATETLTRRGLWWPVMAKAANGWKTCSRGHKWRGPGNCPLCWPGGAKKRAAPSR